jgi:hypothetical protein
LIRERHQQYPSIDDLAGWGDLKRAVRPTSSARHDFRRVFFNDHQLWMRCKQSKRLPKRLVK